MVSIEWAAGFIDGEGCLGIYLQGKEQYVIRLQISNTHLPALQELVRLFPNSAKIGISVKKSKHPERLVCYQLAWCGRKAVEPILRAIEPFTVVKKEQINFVLTQWMPRIKYQGRHGFYNKIEELETRNLLKQELSDMKKKEYLV